MALQLTAPSAMKNPALFLFPALLLACLPIFAQKTKGDTLILHREFHKNGKLSAYSYVLKSREMGKARAWNAQGQLIFECETSRIHGHHSAYFEHYPNGAVRKIEESQAPDAGIQWYRAFYTFDEQGNKTGESHQSHDDSPSRFVPDELKHRETAVCAPIFSNHLMLRNRSGFPMLVHYTQRDKKASVTVLPGDSVLLGNYIQAGFFSDPFAEAAIQLQCSSASRNSQRWKFILQKAETVKLSGQEQRFEYDILQVYR